MPLPPSVWSHYRAVLPGTQLQVAATTAPNLMGKADTNGSLRGPPYKVSLPGASEWLQRLSFVWRLNGLAYPCPRAPCHPPSRPRSSPHAPACALWPIFKRYTNRAQPFTNFIGPGKILHLPGIGSHLDHHLHQRSFALSRS